MTGKEVAIKSWGGLTGRKIKVGTFFMVLAIALLLNISFFLSLYLAGRPPQVNILPYFNSGNMTYRFSIMGEYDKMLLKPMGLKIDDSRLYVADTLNKRVQVYTLDGNYLFDFGTDGTYPGEFQFPYGVEIAANGEVYVSDVYNGDISVFDKDGNFLRYFALFTDVLIQPSGLLISEGKLYVTNLNPGYVMVFDLAGENLLGLIGADDLSFPNDLTMGPDGTLYISDTGNDRVQIYTTEGDFVRTLGVDTQAFMSPRGLAFGNRGELYVVSKLTNEVIIVDSNDNIVATFGDDVFNLPNGIAVDRKGMVYVTDHISVAVFD